MSNIIKPKNKLTALVDFDWDLNSWISLVDVLFEMVTVLCLIQKPIHFINVGVINIVEVEVILVLVILYCLLSTLMKILRILKNKKIKFQNLFRTSLCCQQKTLNNMDIINHDRGFLFTLYTLLIVGRRNKMSLLGWYIKFFTCTSKAWMFLSNMSEILSTIEERIDSPFGVSMV